jgi:threonyl-tRNA synthetase
VQVYVLPLREEQRPEARKVAEDLLALVIRAKPDESVGSLSKRILFAHKFRPYSKLVIGPKDIKSGRLVLQLREENLQVWRVNLADELRKILAMRLPDQRKECF